MRALLAARDMSAERRRAAVLDRRDQAQFDSDKGYKAALLSTLRRTRELIAESKL